MLLMSNTIADPISTRARRIDKEPGWFSAICIETIINPIKQAIKSITSITIILAFAPRLISPRLIHTQPNVALRISLSERNKSSLRKVRATDTTPPTVPTTGSVAVTPVPLGRQT